MVEEIPGYIPRLIPLPKPSDDKIDLSQYDMSSRWASFVQVQINQPWISDAGEKIQNVVLASLALPAGTQHLIGEIIGLARSRVDEDQAFARAYNDYDLLLTSTLEAKKTEVDDGDLNVLEDLMDATEEVIRARFPTLEYDTVTEFFYYQKLRRNNIERLKKDAKKWLFSSDCKNRNAWEGEYEGFFMMKMTVREDGTTKGLNPNGDEDNVNGRITVGNLGHREMMDEIAKENATKCGKVRLRWVADSTRYVSECGGCRSFFEKKMKQIVNLMGKIITSSKSVGFGVVNSFVVAHVVVGSSICLSCGKDKFIEGCECSQSVTI